MNETLINEFDTKNLNENKCYICFDPCDNKSPCGCDLYVHMVCLIKFAQKNNKDSIKCTICKKEIKKLNLRNPNVNNNISNTNFILTNRLNQLTICYVLLNIFLFFVYYAFGLSTILFITKFILNYNIIIYIDLRKNSFIHISSLIIGFFEYNVITKLGNNCIVCIKNRYRRNNDDDSLLQIEN